MKAKMNAGLAIAILSVAMLFSFVAGSRAVPVADGGPILVPCPRNQPNCNINLPPKNS